MKEIARPGVAQRGAPSAPSPMPGFAAAWEDFEALKSQFEDRLLAVLGDGGDFDRLGADSYDSSLEIYGVPNDVRLSHQAQQFIAEAGYAKCYVNHKDIWETHYTWKAPFEPVSGWRVQYGHKAGLDGLKVEGELPPSWPKDWLKSGYVKVVQVLSDGDAKRSSTKANSGTTP